MKTPSADLFHLVKSLTAREKTYFVSRYSKNKEGIIFIYLFHLINKQRDYYDEQKIVKEFQKKGAVKSLKHTKSRLYEAIMNSLTIYHTGTSGNAQLQKLLMQIELLLDKGLNKLAEKKLLKAEKQALISEKFEYLFLLNKERVRLVRNKMDLEKIKAHLDISYKIEQNYIRKIINNIEYNNLTLNVDYIVSRDGEQPAGTDLKKLLRSDLLLSEKKALTFIAMKNYFSLHYTRCWINKLYEEGCKYQKQWVNYLEANPSKWASTPATYFNGLSRLAALLSITKKEKELDTLFEKAFDFYRRIPEKKKNENMRLCLVNILGNYIKGQMEIYYHQKAISAYNSVKNILPFNYLNNDSAVVVNYNLFVCYFMLKIFRKAIEKLNIIINTSTTNLWNVQQAARLSFLIVHYELGNVDILKKLAKDIGKWFIQHNCLGEFERLILNFFQEEQITYICNRAEERKVFDTLYKKLTKEKYITNYHTGFDIKQWVRTKSENKILLPPRP